MLSLLAVVGLLVAQPLRTTTLQRPVARCAVHLQTPEETAPAAPAVKAPAERYNNDGQPMPAVLAEWGCDDELWEKIQGAKGTLRKFARDGNELLARKRIESIRVLVAEEEADPEAAAARKAANIVAYQAVRQGLGRERLGLGLTQGYPEVNPNAKGE